MWLLEMKWKYLNTNLTVHTHIWGAQRMNPGDLGDPILSLSFPSVPTAVFII